VTRTEQAHDWSLYAVLGTFTLAVCYGFLFTDKLPGEAFTAIAGTVFTYFFTRQKAPDTSNTTTNTTSSSVTTPANGEAPKP